MFSNKLFEIDWKIVNINIIVGLAFTIVACALIFGYTHSIYDISHIILFMMVVVLWGGSSGYKNNG